jgi:very-short-patch-repair endonuclease
MKEDVDAAVGRWAADNLGVASDDELRALGMTPTQIDRRVIQRRLIPVHRGVYRIAGAPVTSEGLLRAAVLAAGDPAFASHHGVMRTFGIRGSWDPIPEITIVGTRLPVLAGVRVHRIDRLDPWDTTSRGGTPCLSMPVALLTLGARATQRAVTNATHDAIYRRLTTPARLDEVLHRLGGPGRRGTSKLRVAVNSLPAGGRASQTGLELDLYQLMLRAGWRPVDLVLQHRIVDGDGVARWLDIAVMSSMIDTEADGDRWHSSAEDRADMKRRDAAVRLRGWEPLRFTTADIRETPERTIASLRRAHEHRLRSLSTRPR